MCEAENFPHQNFVIHHEAIRSNITTLKRNKIKTFKCVAYMMSDVAKLFPNFPYKLTEIHRSLTL